MFGNINLLTGKKIDQVSSNGFTPITELNKSDPIPPQGAFEEMIEKARLKYKSQVENLKVNNTFNSPLPESTITAIPDIKIQDIKIPDINISPITTMPNIAIPNMSINTSAFDEFIKSLNSQPDPTSSDATKISSTIGGKKAPGVSFPFIIAGMLTIGALYYFKKK